MNKLVIPPSPNWYSSNILACAADNTVVYGSRNEIIVIHPLPSEQPAEINVLSGIHSARVIFVSLNTNWGNPNKWAVSVGEDNVVQLLDIATCKPKISHVGHKTHSERLVGAVFSGEDKVVSVSEKGFIIMWKLSTNNLTPINSFKGSTVKISTISSCPHAPWLVGLGLRRGGITIIDLKKMGKILFKIHAHEDEVISLSWCPTPFNVFPQTIVKVIKANKEEAKDSELSFNKGETVSVCSSSLCDGEVIGPTNDTTVSIQEETTIDVNITSESSQQSNLTIDDSVELSNEETKANLPREEESVICNPEVNADECNVTTEQPPEDQSIEYEQVTEGIEVGDGCLSLFAESGRQFSSEECCSRAPCKIKSIEGFIMESMVAPKPMHIAHSVDESPSKKAPHNLNAMFLGNTSKEEVIPMTIGLGKCIFQPDNCKVEEMSSIDVNNQNNLNITEEKHLAVTPTAVSSLVNEENIEVNLVNKSLIQQHAEESTPVLETSFNSDCNSSEVSDMLTLKKEFLLASYGRGSRSIKIWRVGTNGLLQTELFPPFPYQKRSQKNYDKSWLSVCWITPTHLLSSTNKGQLLLWNLTKKTEKNSGKSNYYYRVIHADHSKYIFCIAAPFKKYESIDSGNCGDTGELNAWTLGNDRFILNTSIGPENTNLSTYSTIGGTVTCLVPSCITPTRIACGLNDGCNRIWDLSQPHLQRIILTPLFEKHTIKVTSFAWHPSKEDCLAYGTNEGYIGVIDPSNLSKSPTQLVQSCNLPLYHIQWGPLNKSADNLGLYTACNGKLLVYDIKQPLHEPATIEFGVDYNLTSFSWKPDYSVIAIATKNLELLLYNSEFKLLNTFLLQSKIVRCLVWHSCGTSEENWLAISSNQVIVYDCTEKDVEDKSCMYDKCAIAIFSQHKSAVHALSWSPHQSEILASASEDGSALVWNVKSQTLLHACHCYSDVLYAVVWSPFDPDYLITGGKACTIRIWKLSENPPVLRPEKAASKPALTMIGEDDEKIVVAKTETKVRKTTKCFLNGVAQMHNVNTHNELLKNCQRLFSLYTMDQQEIAMYKNEIDKESELNVLNLFGDKNEIDKILQCERENHLNRTTPLSLESVALWQGNIDEAIKNAIKCGSLTPSLVGVAPMVSHNLWQEACEAYAKQLLDSSNNRPVEASFYYLACHKVEEAIEALCAGSYFREAMILAKSRLSATDPLITAIIERWANYATTIGCYEVAAQCYLALNKLEEATKVLFRRTDIPTLEFCFELAKKNGNEDMLNAVLFRLNCFKAECSNTVNDPVTPLPMRLEVESNSVSNDNENERSKEMKTEKDNEVATST